MFHDFLLHRLFSLEGKSRITQYHSHVSLYCVMGCSWLQPVVALQIMDVSIPWYRGYRNIVENIGTYCSSVKYWGNQPSTIPELTMFGGTLGLYCEVCCCWVCHTSTIMATYGCLAFIKQDERPLGILRPWSPKEICAGTCSSFLWVTCDDCDY